MRVGIIGAGPAGITAAYQLAKAGVTVEVFEGSSAVGGMARTIELLGQKVDLGPHRFFSSDPRINRIWLEVAGQDYEMVGRLTRILYKNRFFYYPLKPLNALANLGVFEAVRCVASYARELLAPTPLSATPTFEEWVVSRFGRRLFAIFFQAYSEKLWGIPCAELDADFAAQRIKKFSLLEAVKGAFGLGTTRHKTLVDLFAYPHGGTGSIYARMADQCRARGGTIHLGTPVKRVVVDQKTATGIELADGTCIAFDHVISCMPLTQLVGRMDDLPPPVADALPQLRFRNTILVYLRINGSDLFKDNWLYVHARELATGRITNFRNWVPQLYGSSGDTVLALEYWCYTRDALWRQPDAELIALATAEIGASSLLGRHAVCEGAVVRLENSYPVYACGYKTPLAVVSGYLKGIRNLSVIGRYGAFKYNNQDHSILMGALAAQNIAEGADHDLWSVNTDDEYQESSVITKVGLVAKE
jgi:protoporphyrinogen oxidase